MKKTLIFFALLLFYLCLNAQTGGNNIYEFLNLPWSARTAALGSNFVAAKDDDLTLAIVNPSIIDEKLSKRIALTFVDYFGDANYGMAAYSHTFKKVGSFTTALQFINYGKFLAADETGQTYGNFSGGGFYTIDHKDPLTKDKMQKIFNFFDKMYLEGKVLEKFQFHELIDTYDKYLQWEKEN